MNRNWQRSTLAAMLPAFFGPGDALAQACHPYWARTSPAFTAINVADRSLLTFDDGSGPAPYVSGQLSFNDGPIMQGVAR